MKRTAGLLVFLSAALMSSCATVPYAREVKKRPMEGGVIALRTNPRAEDRTYAESMMRTNCGNKQVTVKEEGEVSVGQVSSASSNTTHNPGSPGRVSKSGWTIGGKPAGENTQATTVTTDVKEWQITYECSAGT